MFQTIWQIYLALLIISAVGSFALIANVMMDRWLELKRQRPLELPDLEPPGEPMPEADETEAGQPEPAVPPVVKTEVLPSSDEVEVASAPATEEHQEATNNLEPPTQPPVPRQQKIFPSPKEE